jgi:MFS family permease
MRSSDIEDGSSSARLPGQEARALRNRNFRIYFAGILVSLPGGWMQMTAQAWLVLKLSNSPLALATVASLQFAPIMIFSLLGGAIADRFPRRKLMFMTQSLAALQAVIMGTIVAHGQVSLWQIYLLAGVLGTINAIDQPLRVAFAGELVDARQLPNAIALSTMAQNLGRVVGPSVGGVALAVLGVSAVFFINAASFAGILCALVLLDGRLMHPTIRPPRRSMAGDIKEAVRYAYGHPSLFFLLLLTSFIGLFGQNFTTMVPLVAEYLVKASAAEFGLLNSFLGAGSFMAAFALSFLGAPTTRRILSAASAFCFFLVAISASSSIVLSSMLFACVGAAAVSFSTSVNTCIQLLSPPDMRGRLASMVTLLIVGSSPLGAFATGLLANTFNVGVAVCFNGIMCGVGVLVAVVYRRSIRKAGIVLEISGKARPREAAGETGQLPDVHDVPSEPVREGRYVA